MATRIKAPFATAQKTAKVLGVSKSRFKLLESLADANTIFYVKAPRKTDIARSRASSSRGSAKSAHPASAKSWAKLAVRSRKRKAKSVKGHSGAKA